MKDLTIYGASDDLIETEGIPGCDEFEACIIGGGVYAGVLRVRSKEGSLDIYCIYDGCWCFAIGTEDGDYDMMPQWPVRRTWGDQVPYSETLRIGVPDDAVLAFERFGDRDYSMTPTPPRINGEISRPVYAAQDEIARLQGLIEIERAKIRAAQLRCRHPQAYRYSACGRTEGPRCPDCGKDPC